MGKDLRGRELGVGIFQRKDGLYSARIMSNGKRVQRYFKKLQDCRKWIADAQFEKEHGNVITSQNPTVDAWYQYWMDEIKGGNIKPTTQKYYNNIYRLYVSGVIGEKLIRDVRPIDCQNALNNLSDYSQSIMRNSRLIMQMIFESAEQHGLISETPVKKGVIAKGNDKKEREALTVEEQADFIEAAKDYEYYNQIALILQTGLRIGEIIGLKWEDIDLKEGTLKVNRTMYVIDGKFVELMPKTKAGRREIPLTKEAIKILKNQRKKYEERKIISVSNSGFVFLSKKGNLIRNKAYSREINSICDKCGIRKISPHILRHTFATRCIEAGMQPKTLQVILGHSTINMTMNIYVHVTESQKKNELKCIEKMLKLV